MFEKEAIEKANEKYPLPQVWNEIHLARNIKYQEGFQDGAEFGYNKANEWHYVKDGDLPKGEEYGKNSIHRKIYLKDRYGNLYTGNYFPKDDNHKEDCFAVEFLDFGFQGSNFCAKEQISEWCEIPTFDKE